jgi:predicted DNA-binding protein
MTINLSMPKQYIDYMKAEHERTGKTYSEIVRCALDAYKDKVEGK